MCVYTYVGLVFIRFYATMCVLGRTLFLKPLKQRPLYMPVLSLLASASTAVQSVVAESIADVAGQGASSSHVAVDMQQGSVAVSAQVTPPGNMPIDGIHAGLGSSVTIVSESMEASLQNVPGLQVALAGNLSVSLLGITTARPVNGTAGSRSTSCLTGRPMRAAAHAARRRGRACFLSFWSPVIK